MKFLHDIFEKQKPNFEKGGKLERFFYAFEAAETIVFTPPATTGPKGVQVRDAIDQKRLMMTVVIAMIPCLLFGIWNAGLQHDLAHSSVEMSFIEQFLFGLRYVLPIVLVSYTAAGLIEFTFAIVRQHPIGEGALVTGMLIPLIVPVTIPLWQVFIATAFAVAIGKEVFGGVGMNILNVALTARAFLYFGYPSQISGEVWVAGPDGNPVLPGGEGVIDSYSGATPLSVAADAVASGSAPVVEAFQTTMAWNPGMFDLQNLFLGTIPGSIGETSALMCLIGAVILLGTGVGSWKIMLSTIIGALATGFLANVLSVNEYMSLPSHYHLVIGGFAFGTVFMATDPVTAAHTETGKWIYGFLIGMLTIIVRVFNPAYPEGIMLAILLMNVFAPLIDYNVVEANKKRRVKRATV